ncbi:MAG: LLM class flavin-dependent oxidoreductase, partial [Solirubrobacteraceae bacterium]
PLRHPLHVAKAAASLDILSGGRFVLGLASGDRPEEFQRFGRRGEDRGAALRDGVADLRSAWAGTVTTGDPGVLPRPTRGRVPLVLTGRGGQDTEWIGSSMDGWFSYFRTHDNLKDFARRWIRASSPSHPNGKPLLLALHLVLESGAGSAPEPVRLGLRTGRDGLRRHLHELAEIGVDHVMLILRHSEREVDEVLYELADHVLTEFPGQRADPR